MQVLSFALLDKKTRVMSAPICLEKCAQRKMLCLDTGLQNSSPLSEIVLQVSVFIEFSVLTGESLSQMSERSK